MKIDIEKSTRRIRRRILADITDRKGWKQEYEQFSPETRREIAWIWAGIIRYELLLATGRLARLKKRKAANTKPSRRRSAEATGSASET